MMLKNGVGCIEQHPALRYAILVVEEECIRETNEGCTITALGNGLHSDGSLHYGISYTGRKSLEADDRCRAADFRTRMYTNATRARIETRVIYRLGLDFDFIFEPDKWDEQGKQIAWQHWHLEYDPKSPF